VEEALECRSEVGAGGHDPARQTDASCHRRPLRRRRADGPDRRGRVRRRRIGLAKSPRLRSRGHRLNLREIAVAFEPDHATPSEMAPVDHLSKGRAVVRSPHSEEHLCALHVHSPLPYDRRIVALDTRGVKGRTEPSFWRPAFGSPRPPRERNGIVAWRRTTVVGGGSAAIAGSLAEGDGASPGK
jgi:hypothetical protein